MSSRSKRDAVFLGRRSATILAAIALSGAGSSDAGLVPSGPEFLLNETTQCHQSRSAVAATPDGGFLALWSDGGNDRNSETDGGIFLRRFDAGGTPLSGEQPIATGTAVAPDVVRVGDVYVVVWAAGDGVWTRRLDA